MSNPQPSAPTSPTLDYYTRRIVTDLGVTDALNYFEAKDIVGQPTQRRRFEQTKTGDIRIYYYRLDGNHYTYQSGKDSYRHAKHLWRDRYVVPKITDDGKEKKYHSPPGSYSCPYFTPQIIQAYQTQTEIPLLVLTEGEFKAVAGCNNGLYVVGLQGLHGFYDTDGSKKLHSDICDLIKVCRVKKLLLLTDADTRTITYKPGKDLNTRPYSFYSSVKNFREAAMYYLDSADSQLADVYYGHIATQHCTTAKGLDDMYKAFNFDKQKVTDALQKLTFDNEHFNIYNISDGLNKIKEHFGLTSAEKFYITYLDYIKEQEFIYNKLTYQWNNEEQKLIRIRHEDVRKFQRIGCDWFKTVLVPNKYKQLDEEIKKWKVSEIVRDYGKSYPTFLEDIPKYEAWCNHPAMGDNYKRVIDGCYNLFNPLKEMPKAGSFENTISFLKHLFGGTGNVIFKQDGSWEETAVLGDPFTVALDYFTLQYRNPMQILPVLCMVSPENNTGKTTMLKWLRDIYGSNATIIDNERFKQSFNSHYISKYIIGIDEGFLDVDKRSEKERLKKLATDDRQYLEFKGADVQEIDFYGKIIICSNDADNLMKIEEGEIRWFVVRVKPFTKENPTLRDSMRAEIPAWLHFINTRTIAHPNVGRAWFSPEHLKTEQLQIIIEKTRNRIDRIVDDFILEVFHTYDIETFKIDLRGLAELINKGGYSKYKIDTMDLKNYLKDKKEMEPQAPSAIRFPVNIDEGNMNSVVFDKSRIARCYEFKRLDWIKVKGSDAPF